MPSRLKTRHLCENGLLPFSPDLKRGKTGLLESLLFTAFHQTSSDLAVWYCLEKDDQIANRNKTVQTMGIYPSPRILYHQEWIAFLRESREMLVLNSRKHHFLESLLLDKNMNSALAFPLFNKQSVSDILILNSSREDHYGKSNCRAVLSLGTVCSGMLY